MEYKEKYKEALKRAEEIITYYREHNRGDEASIEDLESIFPELKESGDEKIRRELIAYFKNNSVYVKWSRLDVKKAIEWLEKQGDIDKTSYEIAEKEKNDFVSGQFIECRKSFDEFKEGNSYWLEYIGNDTYIGRSDNILNQKFHITPRQLYRLFTQQHRPKEDSNVNDETNAPTAYGKYVDECLDEAAKHFFSEGEDKYSVADLFYAGVRCGKSWLEKQGQTFTKKDVDDAYLKGISDAKNELKKQGEKKSIMNVPSREIIFSIWDLGNEWKELTKGKISAEYGTQLEYIQKHWQESEYYLKVKQDEQKPQGKTALEALKEKCTWPSNELMEKIDSLRHKWSIGDSSEAKYKVEAYDELIEMLKEE